MEGLALLILEAGVALGLLVFFVWWTWPRSKPPSGEDGERSSGRDSPGNKPGSD